MRSVASLVLVVGILAVPAPASADPAGVRAARRQHHPAGLHRRRPRLRRQRHPVRAGRRVQRVDRDHRRRRLPHRAARGVERRAGALRARLPGHGTTVFVDNPSLRAHYLSRGFAWAASSYQTNGYDVGQGVRDSYALIHASRSAPGGPPAAVYMTGASMGGHVTAVAIEEHPSAFVGAMPVCGVLGDAELFDYFLDANVTAAALTGTASRSRRRPSIRRSRRCTASRSRRRCRCWARVAGLTALGRSLGRLRRAAQRRHAARLRRRVRLLERRCPRSRR